MGDTGQMSEGVGWWGPALDLASGADFSSEESSGTESSSPLSSLSQDDEHPSQGFRETFRGAIRSIVVGCGPDGGAAAGSNDDTSHDGSVVGEFMIVDSLPLFGSDSSETDSSEVPSCVWWSPKHDTPDCFGLEDVLDAPWIDPPAIVPAMVPAVVPPGLATVTPISPKTIKPIAAPRGNQAGNAPREASCPYCARPCAPHQGLGRFWRKFGYAGPDYCTRCASVFRDHIIIGKSARSARRSWRTARAAASKPSP